MSATAASTSATPAVGSGPNVVRWTGAVGLAALVVFLLATPLYFIGPAGPSDNVDQPMSTTVPLLIIGWRRSGSSFAPALSPKEAGIDHGSRR